MSAHNSTRHQTAFTVSIEAREGVTTGISAHDRARTIQVAIDPAHGREDIVTPGHVFPLAARDGGVLTRAGHTEAAVDVARLAGLIPAGVICEIMNDDGSMARMPDLVSFAQRHGLKIGAIADLISYRRRTETLVKCTHIQPFVSRFGDDWTIRVYRNELEGTENLALVKGNISSGAPTLVRMHTMSILDDVLGRAGGRSFLYQSAMREIAKEGRGVLVMLRHPHSRELSQMLDPPPLDPSESAAIVLREYGVGAQILVDLGVKDMILLTNSRRHLIVGLEGYGLNVVGERPIPPIDRE